MGCKKGTSNGSVVWTNKWGTATWSGTFQVMNTPVIATIAPQSGPSGTVVQFTGTHFENLDPNLGAMVNANNAFTITGGGAGSACP